MKADITKVVDLQPCVSCTKCLFTFHADHTDGLTRNYTCPNCETTELRERIAKLERALNTIADMAEDHQDGPIETTARDALKSEAMKPWITAERLALAAKLSDVGEPEGVGTATAWDQCGKIMDVETKLCAWCSKPTTDTISVFGPVYCCAGRCQDAISFLLDGASLDEARKEYGDDGMRDEVK